jgi:hypothetical protein
VDEVGADGLGRVGCLALGLPGVGGRGLLLDDNQRPRAGLGRSPEPRAASLRVRQASLLEASDWGRHLLGQQGSCEVCGRDPMGLLLVVLIVASGVEQRNKCHGRQPGSHPASIVRAPTPAVAPFILCSALRTAICEEPSASAISRWIRPSSLHSQDVPPVAILHGARRPVYPTLRSERVELPRHLVGQSDAKSLHRRSSRLPRREFEFLTNPPTRRSDLAELPTGDPPRHYQAPPGTVQIPSFPALRRSARGH